MKQRPIELIDCLLCAAISITVVSSISMASLSRYAPVSRATHSGPHLIEPNPGYLAVDTNGQTVRADRAPMPTNTFHLDTNSFHDIGVLHATNLFMLQSNGVNLLSLQSAGGDLYLDDKEPEPTFRRCYVTLGNGQFVIVDRSTKTITAPEGWQWRTNK